MTRYLPRADLRPAQLAADSPQKTERAIALLWEALGQGYPHFHGLHTDLAFASLRDYPPFEELVKPKP